MFCLTHRVRNLYVTPCFDNIRIPYSQPSYVILFSRDVAEFLLIFSIGTRDRGEDRSVFSDDCSLLILVLWHWKNRPAIWAAILLGVQVLLGSIPIYIYIYIDYYQQNSCYQTVLTYWGRIGNMVKSGSPTSSYNDLPSRFNVVLVCWEQFWY